MTVWLLIVTVSFPFLASNKTLDLPGETVFLSQERCLIAGHYVADSLTQDGTTVQWRCVEIGQ